MRALLIGDVVGGVGMRRCCGLPELREAHRPDVVVVNCRERRRRGRHVAPPGAETCSTPGSTS